MLRVSALVAALFSRPAPALRYAALIAAALCLSATSAAPRDLHISGSNRLEYGLARKDGTESFEDLFRLDLRRGGFTFEGRLHLVQPSGGAAAESLDQRSLRFEDEHLDILAGTFYETWGRGLILRAHETRTATVGRVERSLSLDRDIDGVRLRGRYGAGRVTLLSGRPQVTPLSGSFDGGPAGRRDRVRGIRAETDLSRNVRAAGSYLRINGPLPDGGSARDVFSSVELDGDAGGFDGHVEVGHRDASPDLFLEGGDAFYAALGYATGSFGFAAERKDYERFQSLYSEPPTAVKTHSWTLLNRQTHVTNLDDEVGWQAEASWSPDPESGLSLNHSRSDNHTGDDAFRYRQVTLEGRHRAGADGPRLRAVADWSRDILKGDDNRWTAGGEAELLLDDVNSLTLVLEWQQVERLFATTNVHRIATLEYQKSPWLTLTLQGETSRQPVDAQDTWASLTANATWSGRHNLNLFAGRRPAGLLCTGGYCFLAPAFDGVEMRLISRF